MALPTSFEGVVEAVRDFFDHHYYPGIRSDLKIVNGRREHPHGPRFVGIDVGDDLRLFVEKHLAKIHQLPGYIIQIKEISLDQSYFHSFILRWLHRAEIIVTDQINLCHRRRSRVVEYCHLYFTSDHEYFRSVDQQIRFLQDIFIPGMLKGDTAWSTEGAAYLMAIEMMLPWNNRMVATQMKERGATHLEIAECYKIPEFLIDLYFDTDYGKISEAMNKAYDERCKAS